MNRIQYEVDSIHTHAWAERVGKLILNFSCLEFETYSWLIQMSEQPDRLSEFTNKSFKTRGKAIESFIKARSFSVEWKQAALLAWADALELAELRNRIAHNPIAFAWSTGVEQGEPDLIGIIDVNLQTWLMPLRSCQRARLTKQLIGFPIC